MVCNALCRDDVTGDFCTSRLRKKASPAREARTNLFVYVVCEATTDNRVECSATSRRSGSYRSSNAPSSLSGAVEGRPRAWRKSQRKRRAGPPAPHPPSFAAAAHGAIGLHLAVPLVRGLEDGRPDVGCDGIHQEPRATAEGPYRPGVLRKGTGAGAGAESARSTMKRCTGISSSHQGKRRSSTTSRSDARFPTLASTTRKPQQREVTSGRSCALASPTFTEKWRVTC
jgi:hypothetical protein